MANLSKKWGTVMACWAVALVMIITGVCLGLTIPSSAAEDTNEGDIAVMFDANGDGVIGEDETTVYHTIREAFTVLDEFDTTAQKPVTIQLRSNVATSDVQTPVYKDYILDLNGYVWSVSNIMQIINYDNVVNIIDSRPNVKHYFAYVGKGEYEFTDEDYKLGFSTLVEGGVMMCTSDWWPAMFVSSTELSGSQLVLDGGTYLGNLFFGMAGTEQASGEVVINQGVNVRCSVNMNIWEYASISGEVAFMNQGNGKLEIKGGNIYGKIIDAKFSDDGSTMLAAEDIDLTDEENLPKWIHIDERIEMKLQYDDDGNFVCYSAVDADGKPTTTPTGPIAEAEQSANDNNNLIGLIILAAAAAVMVVGVTTIIIINSKRRKKVA